MCTSELADVHMRLVSMHEGRHKHGRRGLADVRKDWQVAVHAWPSVHMGLMCMELLVLSSYYTLIK